MGINGVATAYGYSPYGEVGGGSGSFNSAGLNVEAAIADAMAIAQQFAQANGYELRQQNAAASKNAAMMRQCSDAKAAVEELLGCFPVPTGTESTNPKLSDLPGIMQKRIDDGNLPADQGFNVDQVEKALAALNKILPSLGFPQQDWSMTKSSFDALKTRLTGRQDEVSSTHSMMQTKQGLLVGNINQTQTAEQGLVKASLGMAQGWARIIGQA